jgi:hypothetical protein
MTFTTRVLRFRPKDEHTALLCELAREVNFVWNFLNDVSLKSCAPMNVLTAIASDRQIVASNCAMVSSHDTTMRVRATTADAPEQATILSDVKRDLPVVTTSPDQERGYLRYRDQRES